MAQYIDQAYLEKKLSNKALVQLTDKENVTGEINADVVNAAIDFAQGVFDGYVGTRYVVPLTGAALTETVKGLLADLAIYDLYKDQEMTGPGTIYQAKLDAYRAAVAVLKEIANGRANLAGATLITAGEETVPGTSGRRRRASSSADGTATW